MQASFPCPGHHLFKSLSLFCQLPYCFQICAALPPPHPHGRRDPRPKLSKQLPTSPAGFVLPLSFQEQAPQAPGSAQKTPGIWPSTRLPFPKNGSGSTSSRTSWTGKAGQDCRGLPRAWKGWGAQHGRARSHLKGARSSCTRRAPGTRAPRGHPRTQPNQRQLSWPHRAPNSSNAWEKRNSRDHLPGRLHSSSALFYPNRPPQSQSKRYPQMYPKLPLPFPVFIRSRHSRAPPLHPGPGSIQSRKTNRNSLTSLGRRLVLCYAGCGRSSMGSMSSIPGVDVACRALPDAR